MRDGPPPPFAPTSSSSTTTTTTMFGMSPMRGSTLFTSSSPRNGIGIRSHSSHGTSNGSISSSNYPIRNSSPLRGAGVDYTSTSSLLQEITSLRARLRELEDDNKSSVVSVGVEENKLETLVNTLRNDIAQLQQEKAVQEKDFLNQMSLLQADCTKQMNEMKDAMQQKDELNNAMNDKVRNVMLQNDELNDQLKMIKEERKTLSDQLLSVTVHRDEIKGQLQQAKLESAISRSKNDTEDKYTRLLEDQRESHIKEIEQMKQHLQNADMEIADSRTEMDQLHDEIQEMQNYREALLEEVTTVRLDLSEEKRTSQNLRKEISEMKLKIERLQQEIKEKDIRISNKVDGSSNSSSNNSKVLIEKDKTITKLKDEVERMQSRIQDLEYQENKIKSELELEKKKKAPSVDKTSAKSKDVSNSDAEDRPISPAEKAELVKDMQALESRLLKFHSKLAEKDCKIDDLTASLTEERQINQQLRSEKGIASDTATTKIKSSKKAPPPSLLLPPTVFRTTGSNHNNNNISMNGGDDEQPRTPVSGLVATFERHSKNIRTSSDGNNNVTDTDANTVESELVPASELVEIQQSLKREKRLVLELQKQLRTDKQTIWELQEKLRSGKADNHQQQQQQSSSKCASPTSLMAELRESKKENERLQAMLRENERASTKSVNSKERAELAKLRSDAVYASMERDDNEQTIKECREEIHRLRNQIKQQGQSFSEEKKSDTHDDEMTDLRVQLVQKEQQLEKLQKEMQQYENETEEELSRLRSQVDALQSELEKAMTKIEVMQTELSGGSNGRDRKSLERELKTMELELAMSKASYNDLISEHAKKVKELEDNITVLEAANAELANETPEAVQREFANQKHALNEELEKNQAKLLDYELSSSLKIKDLEDRIKSLQVELEEEKKEKDSLQKCLETSAAAAVDAQKVNTEIDRLASDLTAAHLDKKNSDRENLEKIRLLEDEIEILEIEANEELEMKTKEIDALKMEVERKEENIQRLEKEKQQLCYSMNDASFSRKGEIEELQAELLDMTNQSKAQGREIQMLQMKVSEYENRKDEMNGKYERRIRELEDEIRTLNETARKVSNDREGILQLKAENATLRETLRDVKIDRRQMKDKLDHITQDRTSISRSSQLLRDRNTELQEEVEKLVKRLKKIESNASRYAAF